MNQINEKLNNFNVEQLFNDNNLLEALSKGFHFEFDNEMHKNIVTSFIKSRNLEEILDRIIDVNDITFIIVNTLEPKLILLRSLINNNLDKVKEILKSSYINEKHVNFIIDSLNLDLLKKDKEILEIGISKGYKFNQSTLEVLEQDKSLLIKKLESITNLEELLDLINSLSETTLKDSLIVNLAITKGYYFTKKTPKILKDNKETLKRILANIHSNDNNNLYIKETIDNCNPDILDEQILNIAKNKLSYVVTINSPIEKINEIYIKHYSEYLKIFTGKTREKYIKLGQKIGGGLLYYERNNSLFNKEVVDAFGVNAITKIYKYYSLLGNSIDFEDLIKNNKLEKFKYLFTVLSDNNDNFKTFDMLLFLDFLSKYEKYGDLCFDFISVNGIDEENKEILRTLFSHKYKNIEIKDINDLKNIDSIIKENNKKIIQGNSKLEIKNIICIMLCNLTLDELNEMFYSIDEHNLTKLKEEINDNSIKLILEKYIILIKFLDYIRNCNDLEKLKIIADKINSFDSKKLSHNFIGIFKNIKYFYGIEVNSKLMNLHILKSSEKVSIINDRYKASNGNYVKYIEIFDDCIFFQHVMNAFGKGGKLYYFKNPKLVGQSRLCLSLVSNNQPGIERVPIDMEHVTLIFDHIEPSSLIAMDSKDISSTVQLNHLIVLYNNYIQFNITNDMLLRIGNNDYSEYDVYLENPDGTFIYPSGVKVAGNEPVQAETDAAEYLNVSLVKMNKTKKIENKNLEEKVTNYSELELYELNKLRKIFDDLKKTTKNK